MNENIELTKILNGCPKGTKFYSSVYGVVEFAGIDYINEPTHPIRIKTELGGHCQIANDGRALNAYKGECTFFPSKDQRDWSRFERFWNKPKVKRFDPHTLQPFDKVLVKDDYGIWQVEFFSHICQREPDGWCQCSGDIYYFCIPYNEETMSLVGTNDDCPEYYKWWEE